MFFYFFVLKLCGYTRLYWKVEVAAAIVLVTLSIWPTRLKAQEPALSNDRFDVTGNGLIDDADAQRVTDAWFRLQLAGQCIAPQWANYDFNGDSCIDVADIQLVLAHWGEQTATLKTPPDKNSLPPFAVFTINSSGAEGDKDLNDYECRTSGNKCTLAAAIQQANARPGKEMIQFYIVNSDGSCPGVVTIRPSSSQELIIDDPRDDGVIINGYTQCGASPNSQTGSGNAAIKIQIQGGRDRDGLTIYSANNIVRGLAFYYWSHQIYVYGNGAKNNIIEGNFIGSNASNNCAGSGDEGIALEWGANYNFVGGIVPAARNVVMCQSKDAVELFGAGVHNNRVIGNYIGVKQDGRTDGGNNADGVDLAEGASYNWIGGHGPGEGNIISKNERDGIEISHFTSTNHNYVVGNRIGLSGSGTQAVGNGGNGITLEDLVHTNFIYYNIIVGNGENGARGYGLCHYNQIHSNYIGVGADGWTAMPNGTNSTTGEGRNGIYLYGGCQHNLIWNNIIAHHPEHGILLSRYRGYLSYANGETHYNTISQNRIYNNAHMGIRLAPDGSKYPNKGIDPPYITFANTTSVYGLACSNCKIEIFIADKTGLSDPSGDNAGEGQAFIGTGVADAAGNFGVAISGVGPGQLITGTATDSDGNTSEFAQNVGVTLAALAPGFEPTPTPIPVSNPLPGTGANILWLPVILR